MAAGTTLALAGSLGTAAAAPGTGTRGTGAPASGASAVEGVWRMDGYGMVVTVGDGQLQAWDTTAISCVPSLSAAQDGVSGPGGTVRFTADGLALNVQPRAGGRAALTVEGGVGTRGLRRIDALPALCGQPQETGPVATFDVFWQTFQEHYAFFAKRGVDWNAVRDKYRPRVHSGTTQDELFGILAEMVAPLQDAHVFLAAETPEFTRSARTPRPGTVEPTLEYDDGIKAFIERRDLGGKPLEEYAQGAIGYADLPGGIGYLRINRFVAYAPGTPEYRADSAELTRVLDRIVTRARTSGPTAWRGLIVDVRVNAGGSDALGLQIAARLTDRPYFAYAKQARNRPDDDTRFTRREPLRVVPAAGSPRYTGPVALLTGGSTVSAGETFTQALMGRPATTRIGEHTQGVLSDVLGRTLPNGWQFGLSNEKYTNARGHSFEGPGIPPHVATPVFTKEEIDADLDSAFDRAKTLLTGTGTRR
jgi:hypothetical protein